MSELRVAQVVTEIPLQESTSSLDVAQVAVEIPLLESTSSLDVAQVAVEIILNEPTQLNVAQYVVEVCVSSQVQYRIFDTLPFNQDARLNSINQLLTFNQIVNVDALIRIFQYLSLSDVSRSSIFILTIDQNFNFSEQIELKSHEIVVQTLNLDDESERVLWPLQKHLHVINLIQNVRREATLNFRRLQNIHFYDITYYKRIINKNLNQGLFFIQSADQLFVKIQDSISFSQLSQNIKLLPTIQTHNVLLFLGQVHLNKKSNFNIQDSFIISDILYYSFPTGYIFLRSESASIIIRSPQFNDTEAMNIILEKKIAYNGQVYTYIKNPGTSILKYTFLVQREKGYDLAAFFLDSAHKKLRLENWKGEIWVGHLINDQLEIDGVKRSIYCSSQELIEVSIEFEGVRLH